MSNEKKYIMVECLSTYRMRYAVELNADDPDVWACDTVVMSPDIELGQQWLGESIFSHREVSKEDLVKYAVEDCDAYKSWTEEKVIDRLVIRDHPTLTCPSIIDKEKLMDDVAKQNAEGMPDDSL